MWKRGSKRMKGRHGRHVERIGMKGSVILPGLKLEISASFILFWEEIHLYFSIKNTWKFKGWFCVSSPGNGKRKGLWSNCFPGIYASLKQVRNPEMVQKRIANSYGRTDGRTEGQMTNCEERRDECTGWRQTDGLTDKLTNWQFDKLTNWQTDILAYWKTGVKNRSWTLERFRKGRTDGSDWRADGSCPPPLLPRLTPSQIKFLNICSL